MINNEYFPSMLPADELAQLKFIPTLPEFVTWIEQKWSDLPCLSDTVNTYNYKQVCDLIARKRALLNDLGLQKGDKVAIIDNSTIEQVEMFLAVTSAGYVAINLPAMLPAQAIVGCCMKFGVKVLAYGKDFADLRSWQSTRPSSLRECAASQPCVWPDSWHFVGAV